MGKRLPPEFRKYLAAIGSKGGQRSARVDDTGPADAARETGGHGEVEEVEVKLKKGGTGYGPQRTGRGACRMNGA